MAVQLEFQHYGVIVGTQQVWGNGRTRVPQNRSTEFSLEHIYVYDLLEKKFPEEKWQEVKRLADKFLAERKGLEHDGPPTE